MPNDAVATGEGKEAVRRPTLSVAVVEGRSGRHRQDAWNVQQDGVSEDRRKMVQAWADYLDALRNGAKI